ncbi:hypothetical protein BU52_01385 [Streptomyces toyocaensis]|uniref:Uncharacterized protein n=1 Tax=Streptomyces toyocaensis TaxID=55952 RepID=A0A081XYV6_STRTO|nr:hypothetical protein BU52_01385 [Streptomyces toyocaensis]
MRPAGPSPPEPGRPGPGARRRGPCSTACVRTRTPEDTARAAAPDPHRLVPLLLTAARGVSDGRHRDLLHALRVAGFAA